MDVIVGNENAAAPCRLISTLPDDVRPEYPMQWPLPQVVRRPPPAARRRGADVPGRGIGGSFWEMKAGAVAAYTRRPGRQEVALKSIAVLVSGSGTNLQAILDRRAADPSAGFDVVAVLSDRPDVKALARADAAGVPSEVVEWQRGVDRSAFTSAMCDRARAHGADALVLAGFMRILGPEAMARFPDAILNTHPALLPSFPGAHAVRDALAHGVKVTGVTVHFVDEDVDTGPIIAQSPVEIIEGDDEDTLHQRIQAVEHRLFVDAIVAFAQDRLRIEGRKVVWE